MAPPPIRATLAFVLATVLLVSVEAASSPGAAHAPVVDEPAAASTSRWAAEHDEVAVASCTAGEWCGGGGGEASRRRKLGWGNNIGYDALGRNAVPCSYRGASYYNCRPGAQANPYSRGCSAIARCRDG